MIFIQQLVNILIRFIRKSEKGKKECIYIANCVKLYQIYKTIIKLNPEFMSNIFKVKENRRLVREQ